MFVFPPPVIVPMETGPAAVTVWVAVFAWVTVPSEPGLEIRMLTLTFVGAICVAEATPVAAAVVPDVVAVAVAAFVWVTAPLSPGLATRMSRFVLLGASWVASAVDVASNESSSVPTLVALALAEFVCVTAPSSPGLATRTPTFLFFAPLWCADAVASAFCPLLPLLLPLLLLSLLLLLLLPALDP